MALFSLVLIVGLPYLMDNRKQSPFVAPSQVKPRADQKKLTTTPAPNSKNSNPNLPSPRPSRGTSPVLLGRANNLAPLLPVREPLRAIPEVGVARRLRVRRMMRKIPWRICRISTLRDGLLGRRRDDGQSLWAGREGMGWRSLVESLKL